MKREKQLPGVVLQKVALKNFGKLKGKHLRQSLLLITLRIFWKHFFDIRYFLVSIRYFLIKSNTVYTHITRNWCISKHRAQQYVCSGVPKFWLVHTRNFHNPRYRGAKTRLKNVPPCRQNLRRRHWHFNTLPVLWMRVQTGILILTIKK